MAKKDAAFSRQNPGQLDLLVLAIMIPGMSVLEIKQRLSRLSPRQQLEIQVYLHQLKRRTSAWKKATAKKIEEVRAGKFTTLEELEARLRRG